MKKSKRIDYFLLILFLLSIAIGLLVPSKSIYEKFYIIFKITLPFGCIIYVLISTILNIKNRFQILTVSFIAATTGFYYREIYREINSLFVASLTFLYLINLFLYFSKKENKGKDGRTILLISLAILLSLNLLQCTFLSI